MLTDCIASSQKQPIDKFTEVGVRRDRAGKAIKASQSFCERIEQTRAGLIQLKSRPTLLTVFMDRITTLKPLKRRRVQSPTLAWPQISPYV